MMRWDVAQTRSYPPKWIFWVLIATMVITASSAFGHGGKEHTAGSFTRFQALQKAINLYDRLIVSGKLDESWETGLMQVAISVREKSKERELVVSFKRNEGTPDTVYFFFKADGNYAGSNFSGK